jgi:hypothetical protein
MTMPTRLTGARLRVRPGLRQRKGGCSSARDGIYA